MVRALVLRGAAIGALAGLIAFVFARIFAEPLIQAAVDYEGGRAKFQVKVGDRVLFSSYSGSEVTLDGKEFLIMTEDDILAVVD